MYKPKEPVHPKHDGGVKHDDKGHKDETEPCDEPKETGTGTDSGVDGSYGKTSDNSGSNVQTSILALGSAVVAALLF